MTVIRYWRVGLFAGLSFDDVAFATSGKDLLLEGHGYWADALHPFAAWWVALFHKLFGISVVNVGIAFATLRSLGEFFLILAARRLFPSQPWAPFMVAAVSGSSFLGMLYGKQHLASLLFTIPLALWLYTRYLDSGKWRDWILCGVASGLVFLAHYNTIAFLGMMVGLEMIRKILTGGKLPHVFLIGFSGIFSCFTTVTLGGKWSYHYGKLFKYIQDLRTLMTANQKRVFSGLSDGFLLGFASWEGAAILFYVAGCVWMVRRMILDRERRLLAFALIPILGVPLVFLRVNMGFLSYPRLYVFALPFLWIGAGGFLASMTLRLFKGFSDSFHRAAALVIAIGAISLGFSHHDMMARYPSANAALEKYFQAHPTRKMVIWKGNPHLAAFLVGWNFCPATNESQEDADHFWESMNPPAFKKHLPPEAGDPKNRVYLNRPDLPRVCDLIVLENFSIHALAKFDSLVGHTWPNAFSTNFYNGVSEYLPVQADEGDLLSADQSFGSDNRLPLIRLYDLRGK